MARSNSSNGLADEQFYQPNIRVDKEFKRSLAIQAESNVCLIAACYCVVFLFGIIAGTFIKLF